MHLLSFVEQNQKGAQLRTSNTSLMPFSRYKRQKKNGKFAARRRSIKEKKNYKPLIFVENVKL